MGSGGWKVEGGKWSGKELRRGEEKEGMVNDGSLTKNDGHLRLIPGRSYEKPPGNFSYEITVPPVQAMNIG